MKEIKKGLESRRKKLKEQIEYNIERISSAKKGVIAYIKKHPERSREIMEIVDSYDVEMDDE
jgi:DNA-dependent RNA polymerase auxiliary subunit epsilon